MHYIILKSRLFNRWHVYSMGHLEGDRTWLATFRHAQDAAAWIGEPHALSPADRYTPTTPQPKGDRK